MKRRAFLRGLYLLAAVFSVCLLVSCKGESTSAGDTPAPSEQPGPTATLPIEGKVELNGTVELQLIDGEYHVNCQSDLPHGAFVDVFISDQMGNYLDNAEDVMQKDGAVHASFGKDNIEALAHDNGAQEIRASVMFYPGAASQPATVEETYGSQGEYLIGDNVLQDQMDKQYYVQLDSGLLSLE